MNGIKPPKVRTISRSTSRKKSRRGSPVLNTTKCANCQKVPEHCIIEFGKDYVWCADCWLEYLKDVRKALDKPAGDTLK